MKKILLGLLVFVSFCNGDKTCLQSAKNPGTLARTPENTVSLIRAQQQLEREMILEEYPNLKQKVNYHKLIWEPIIDSLQRQVKN